jgi:predicted acetyltransferase
VSWRIRQGTDRDLAAVLRLGERGFGHDYQRPDRLRSLRRRLELDRFWFATDPEGADAEIGMAGSHAFEVTLPGGATVPAGGIAMVVVQATHRRRGILRALFAAQHRALLAEGRPVALLKASEGGIYSRFGYAPVSRERLVSIDRSRARFRADRPDPGGVRYVSVEEARKFNPEVYRRWAAVTPGAIGRSEAWWDAVLADPEEDRLGDSRRFHLLHPDGCASYRISGGLGGGSNAIRAPLRVATVDAFFAATDRAHEALWRVLLGLDLVDVVRTLCSPLDDPLPELLTDGRVVGTEAVQDALWGRILDVPAALSARRYRAELDLVVEVSDGFLDRGGRFRLRGGPDAACCEPTEQPADLRTDIGSLTRLLFGSTRATPLARAGLLAAGPAVLAQVDAGFGADREAQHGTDF